MSIAAVHAVYFSGTGTTEKTVRRIARRLADKLGAAYAEYRYTLPDVRKKELTIPAGDLAVVGCPTYAGRVPNLLMPYLRDMVRGAGALAVPVVLFGNRNYDDALMELSKLLSADGFTCVAGAALWESTAFPVRWAPAVPTTPIWRRWTPLPTVSPPSWRQGTPLPSP